MSEDAVLKLLKRRAMSIPPRSDGEPNLRPTSSLDDVERAEEMLGFHLPPLLRRIYCEVANGGCMLGPSYGILGLPGGYDNDDGWDIVKISLEMQASYEWWDQSIVICDWGCCELSCIDCGDEDFPVYRFNGNYVEESQNDDEPPDHVWYSESDSFEEWVQIPNARET